MNLRHLAPKASALPGCATPRTVRLCHSAPEGSKPIAHSRDAQRRRTVRSRFFGTLPGAARSGDEDAADTFERVPDPGPDPSRQAMNDESMQRLEAALHRLPARQQQAFALRCLEGMDVAEAAAAMGCAEGSVKTHYFRALQALRAQLSEVW